MKIVTKKFIECPRCGHLIPVEPKKRSAETRKQISRGMKNKWSARRLDSAIGGKLDSEVKKAKET